MGECKPQKWVNLEISGTGKDFPFDELVYVLASLIEEDQWHILIDKIIKHRNKDKGDKPLGQDAFPLTLVPTTITIGYKEENKDENNN